MARADWLTDRRSQVAAEKVLDAAEQLFTERDPASVGMHDIARAAGCSRATLYRYFENRDALHTAYVHRWANTVYRQMTAKLSAVTDPRDRLISGITEALAMVRQNPALAAWFTRTGPPIGGEMAERSEVITAMVATFVTGLGADEPDTVQRRARWVVRVMTSLLIFPGGDADAERAMLADFVVPVVAPAGVSAVSTRRT